MGMKKLLLEFERVDSKEGIVKELFVIDNPLAGSFKVSNGKITAYIYVNEDSVELFVIDDKGNVKTGEITV